jgi:hypothetical protein
MGFKELARLTRGGERVHRGAAGRESSKKQRRCQSGMTQSHPCVWFMFVVAIETHRCMVSAWHMLQADKVSGTQTSLIQRSFLAATRQFNFRGSRGASCRSKTPTRGHCNVRLHVVVDHTTIQIFARYELFGFWGHCFYAMEDLRLIIHL